LERCQEIVAKLKRTPGMKWVDPEFGPTSKRKKEESNKNKADDPKGIMSMFFNELTIPNGKKEMCGKKKVRFS